MMVSVRQECKKYKILPPPGTLNVETVNLVLDQVAKIKVLQIEHMGMDLDFDVYGGGGEHGIDIGEGYETDSSDDEDFQDHCAEPTLKTKRFKRG